MKAKTIKKGKSPGDKEIATTKLPWKKVKLSGNLLSDDGGASLEGLLGLEVLENYSGLSITKQKLPKTKRQKISSKHNDCGESDDSDSDRSRGNKNQRKKKKKKLENNKQTKVLTKNHTNHEPGKFVRPLSYSGNDSAISKSHNAETRMKSKKSVDQTQNTDSVLTINDLYVSSYFISE